MPRRLEGFHRGGPGPIWAEGPMKLIKVYVISRFVITEVYCIYKACFSYLVQTKGLPCKLNGFKYSLGSSLMLFLLFSCTMKLKFLDFFYLKHRIDFRRILRKSIMSGIFLRFICVVINSFCSFEE